MTAGERLRNWIDEVAQFWAERLGDWGGTMIGHGIDAFMKILGKSAAPKLKPIIESWEKSGLVPPELQPLLEEIKDPTGEFAALLGGAAGGAAAGSLVGSTIGPWLMLLQYNVQKLAKQYRLDPMAVITAWRRDPEAYKKYFEDLGDQGWDEERIEALKFLTMFVPTAQDQINWLAKEVFEPDMIDRYGLKDELPSYAETDFSKIGVDEKQMANYWMAHWEHASFSQVIEMLHRGTLSLDKEMPAPPTTKEGWATRDSEGDKALYDWYRLVEIPPFWRARLTAMSWNVPTRVDVRRWWDMRTISEERLRSIYHAQGFHGEDLDNYVLWTKVYVAYPDLMARWGKGWITLDEVRSELTGLGMPADRVEEMIQTKIQSIEPERTTGERALTKTDIYKGIKADRITRAEGVELLMDLGFDEDEADLLVDTNIPEDELDVVVAQRELTKTDILKGLKEAVITRDQARERLLELRYSTLDAEFLLKIFDAQVKPPVETAGREASKADIVTAVKKGLITPEDAYLMLQDINFTPEAAMFILEVKAEVSPFSPINFAEFKDRTQKYRVAAGMEANPMPEEIKKAAAEVVKLTGEVEALTRSVEEEQRGLVAGEPLPEETTKRLKSLQVKRNRAISTLEKAKSDYNQLLSEWRHGLP